jgi:hypothetical protein
MQAFGVLHVPGMFILADQRTGTPEELAANVRQYREYLRRNRQRFPPMAHRLASSAWYLDPTDHRCPHDGWLEHLVITEPSSGERNQHRSVAIRIRLLDAYHRGHIELHYPVVFRYQLTSGGTGAGHGDWLYDELRISEQNHLLHEIEWWHAGQLERWLIEASDVIYSWTVREP